MSFRIQHNVGSLNAQRHLTTNTKNMQTALEKLSSGYRINSAKDDAAGLASSMRFRAEIVSLKQATRNAAEATSLLQVAEGAMSQISLILTRMKELATQAASGNAGSDRAKIDVEATALETEITRIVGYTEYNGSTLLDGTFGATDLSSTSAPVDFTSANGIEHIDVSGAQGGTVFQVTAISLAGDTITVSDGSVSQTLDYSAAIGLGANEDATLNFDQLGIVLKVNSAFDESAFTAGVSQIETGATGQALFQIGANNDSTSQMGFNLADLSLSTLAAGMSADIDLTTQATAQTALDTIADAIDTLALKNADLGALMNRLGYAQSTLSVAIENKVASESIIRDVDMAGEMSEFTKHNILIQAGTSMLAQANQLPNAVLSLLQ